MNPQTLSRVSWTHVRLSRDVEIPSGPQDPDILDDWRHTTTFAAGTQFRTRQGTGYVEIERDGQAIMVDFYPGIQHKFAGAFCTMAMWLMDAFEEVPSPPAVPLDRAARAELALALDAIIRCGGLLETDCGALRTCIQQRLGSTGMEERRRRDVLARTVGVPTTALYPHKASRREAVSDEHRQWIWVYPNKHSVLYCVLHPEDGAPGKDWISDESIVDGYVIWWLA